jgi:hypothetical protein
MLIPMLLLYRTTVHCTVQYGRLSFRPHIGDKYSKSVSPLPGGRFGWCWWFLVPLIRGGGGLNNAGPEEANWDTGIIPDKDSHTRIKKPI